MRTHTHKYMHTYALWFALTLPCLVIVFVYLTIFDLLNLSKGKVTSTLSIKFVDHINKHIKHVIAALNIHTHTYMDTNAHTMFLLIYGYVRMRC